MQARKDLVMNRKEADAAMPRAKQQAGESPAFHRRFGAGPARDTRDCAMDLKGQVHAGPRLLANETGGSEEPLPIWLAVLMAADCQARGNGADHDVRWDCESGRAVYTNYGRDAEWIEPLGVSLSGGETLAVYWTPGETAYTLEVYSHAEKCA
jgi:hypothetical protein